MPGVPGHGAEGVRAAGREGVHAAGAHVHEQRPGVAVPLDVRHRQGGHKPPHEEPGTKRGPLEPQGRGLLWMPHRTICCPPFC